jgi:predicted nucleic acid-binding protein
MNYLVDTNVISEIRKENCNPTVREFMESLDGESLYISVISLGEIQYGITKVESRKKKDELLSWLSEQLATWFNGRIIPIDINVALIWGQMRAEHKATLPAADSLLAATALAHRLTVLTRNEKDFADIDGVRVINPWDEYRDVRL